MSAAVIGHLVAPRASGLPPGRAHATVIRFPVERAATGPRRRPTTAERCAPPLCITRRGRLLVTTSVLSAVLAVVGVVGGDVALAGGDIAPEPARGVVVLPGQTLNQLAAAVPGDADVRDVAAEIRELNQLGGSALLAGQELLLPGRVD